MTIGKMAMNHVAWIGSQKPCEPDRTLAEPHDTRARTPTQKDRLNARCRELGSLRRFTRLISRLVDHDEPDDMATRLQFTTQIDRKSLGPAWPQIADNLRDHHVESQTDQDVISLRARRLTPPIRVGIGWRMSTSPLGILLHCSPSFQLALLQVFSACRRCDCRVLPSLSGSNRPPCERRPYRLMSRCNDGTTGRKKLSGQSEKNDGTAPVDDCMVRCLVSPCRQHHTSSLSPG